MLANYSLLAVRNLLKQRGYALVNIFGLAVGLGAAIYILLYVKDELTFDRMHPNAENLYRIGLSLQAPNGDVNTGGYAPAGWDNYIQFNYEGIGAIASFIRRGMPTSIHHIPTDKIVLAEDDDCFTWAEPSINEILFIPIIKGAQTNPLKEINSMILTESVANANFFGALLLKVFGKLLLIASVVGVPVAYFLSRNWLENFVYRTPLAATVFAGALLVIGVIKLITVGYETLKAATTNPIKAIRYEG